MKYTQGELKIKKILQKKRIKFKPQFRTIIDGRVHIFDFAILDREGVKAFIEYDGEQHYNSISVFGGEKGLKERQDRDREKNIYCGKNGISLIRVPYFEKDIEKFLKPKLKGIKKLPSVDVDQYKKPMPFEKHYKLKLFFYKMFH